MGLVVLGAATSTEGIRGTVALLGFEDVTLPAISTVASAFEPRVIDPNRFAVF